MNEKEKFWDDYFVGLDKVAKQRMFSGHTPFLYRVYLMIHTVLYFRYFHPCCALYHGINKEPIWNIFVWMGISFIIGYLL